MLSSGLQQLIQWLQGSQAMPIVVATVAMLLLMASMRRRDRANRRPPPTPAPPPKRPEPASGQSVRRDLDDLMVELQDLSRRISAEIDTRFVKLEAAMRDADRRIAVLNRLSRELGTAQIEAARGTPGTPLASAGTAGASAAGNEPVAPHPDVRHTVIYELADAGFTPVEIARELGRTPGEVELILNLRQASVKA